MATYKPNLLVCIKNNYHSFRRGKNYNIRPGNQPPLLAEY